MIALLRGTAAGATEDAAVVDVGGVGYLVHCAASTLKRLPRTGQPVELHVETQVREDAITLFGFLEPADRTWFRLLQSVQGVGAKSSAPMAPDRPPTPSPPAVGRAPTRSLSSATIRAASFEPTPFARVIVALSPSAIAVARSPGRSAERIESAALAPTPCTD